MNPSELEKRLLEAFSEEAEERLENLFSKLSELENATREDKRCEALEIVFREAHSLKGAARSVNLAPIESLCQALETVFGRLKAETLAFSPRLFDSLHDAAKAVEQYAVGDESARAAIRPAMVELEKRLEALATAENPEEDSQSSLQAPIVDSHALEPDESQTPDPPPVDLATDSRQSASDTIRISSSKLDALLLKTEELIVLKQFAGQLLARLKEFRDALEFQARQNEKLQDELFNPASRDFLRDTSGVRDHLKRIADNHRDAVEGMKGLVKSVEKGNRSVSTMVDDLLNDMKKATLLPFSTLFAILPRMTREIARDQNKKIELRLSGGDIEVDKRILERIKDPLIHILRNAIDHGIEAPARRALSGKPEKGTISIRVSHVESNRVEVTISDDGAGIDVSALHAKAVKTGIIKETDVENLTEDESVALIFHSGLSTSRLITEISGRGLGMAIVKETVENLGGHLKIVNSVGRGTTLKLRLPITQATFRGILIASAGHRFIVPNAQVLHVIPVRREDIGHLENRPVIRIAQRAVGLVHLSTVLGLPAPTEKKKYNGHNGSGTHTAAILGSEDEQVAFIIDGVINEQEVLVKSLGKQLRRVPLIAGATVLGSGQVVPVLNVRELIMAAAGKHDISTGTESTTEKIPIEKRSVLVVEDSFTSRTLLKNILEASGYAVQTAINGEDGFGMLKTGTFDAVVSDVEMPRMNGFELTKKIRAEKGIAETPVILVTSLDSRQDKERGIDAGADAYIVKTRFDQGNLLDVLEQLIE